MLHVIHTEEAKRMIDFSQMAKYKDLYIKKEMSLPVQKLI